MSSVSIPAAKMIRPEIMVKRLKTEIIPTTTTILPTAFRSAAARCGIFEMNPALRRITTNAKTPVKNRSTKIMIPKP
jgi:hypothetical protein